MVKKTKNSKQIRKAAPAVGILSWMGVAWQKVLLLARRAATVKSQVSLNKKALPNPGDTAEFVTGAPESPGYVLGCSSTAAGETGARYSRSDYPAYITTDSTNDAVTSFVASQDELDGDITEDNVPP